MKAAVRRERPREKEGGSGGGLYRKHRLHLYKKRVIRIPFFYMLVTI